MALSVTAVSISVSPFFIEDEATDMFITSAPSRLPASSNEDCVRVEASKNRLIWVRPRSDVRFFSTWRLSSTNSSARSSRPVMSACESPSIPNRCRRLRTNEDFGAMFIKAGSIGASRGAPQGRARVMHNECERAASCGPRLNRPFEDLKALILRSGRSPRLEGWGRRSRTPARPASSFETRRLRRRSSG